MLVSRFVAAAITALSLFTTASTASAQVVTGAEHCVIGVSTSDALNVRSRNDARSKVVARLPYGQCGVVVVSDCNLSWCPIEDGHNAGWVNSRYLAMVSPAMYCVDGVAAGDVLNLRAYPSANSRIVVKLPPNKCDIALLPYATGRWQKVRVGGDEGWVNMSFVSGQ